MELVSGRQSARVNLRGRAPAKAKRVYLFIYIHLSKVTSGQSCGAEVAPTCAQTRRASPFFNSPNLVNEMKRFADEIFNRRTALFHHYCDYFHLYFAISIHPKGAHTRAPPTRNSLWCELLGRLCLASFLSRRRIRTCPNLGLFLSHFPSVCLSVCVSVSLRERQSANLNSGLFALVGAQTNARLAISFHLYLSQPLALASGANLASANAKPKIMHPKSQLTQS